QAGALEQARAEQREALSLARTVIENQATTPLTPATIYIPRDRKLPEFSGRSTNAGELSIEEWVASMKSAFRVMRVPTEDHVEFVKQHLKEEAKATVRFMLSGQEKSADDIFKTLLDPYGDKVPIGTRLKDFYERKQMQTIRSYSYDLQLRLSRVQRRESNSIPDAESVLKEQLILGLPDDFLKREMRRQIKEDASLTFVQVMQAAITWSEEEETQTANNQKTSTRVRVVNADAEQASSMLNLEKLHEAIQKIAARQEQLYQTVHDNNRVQLQPSHPRKQPLKDSDGRYVIPAVNQGTLADAVHTLKQLRCLISCVVLLGQLEGILKESTNPWASPAVIAVKKDGSVRFCCDYRRLNRVTCKDTYPLPRVEESLDALGNAQLFFTLDLKASYFQVAMSERDREKTAVTTLFGLFEWTRMPFGLCNAPATFQRLMGVVLGDLSYDVLLIYLDDIIVFSRDFRGHCERLELVFERLKCHGLKLKPSKCFLFRSEVTQKLHVISSEGIKVDSEKTSPEQEDTEKDFIRMNSEEVHACLWPGQEAKQGRTDIKLAVQASIQKVVNGYNWDEIRALQRSDPLIGPIYHA
ncbi:hypothetical protein QTP86_015450, partial [Hemibagrus guttatus]